MSTYPTISPAITLDFQKSKQLDPRISFSRSSTATYVEGGVIKYADEHQARFEAEGLLIEESRTNLVQYSEDFSQTSQWAPVAVSFNLDSAAVAPDGSTGTYKVVETATSGSHYVRCSPSNQCIAGTTYTYSMFCKAAERTQIMIHFDQEGNNTYFDLSSGEIVSGTIGTIKSVGNGWYYCSITLNPASNTEPKFYTAVNGDINTPGDGVSGLYVWGGQLEANADFPTSYIPTAGATATRAAEICSLDGPNFLSWFNRTGKEHTIVYSTNTRIPNFTLLRGTGGSPGHSASRTTGSYNYTYDRLNITLGNRDGGGATLFWSLSGTYPARFAPATTAVAFKAGSNAGAYGGNIIAQSGSNIVTDNALNTLILSGYSQGFVPNPNGHISRLSYYPRRLSDLELQTLTL